MGAARERGSHLTVGRGAELENRRAPLRSEARSSGRVLLATMTVITLGSAAVSASPLLFPRIPHMLIPSWMHISLGTCLVWTIAHSVRLHGKRRTWAFFALALSVPTALEMTGVRWGFPSGLYGYTAPWRPVIAGVPLLIMMSWPVLIYAAWCAAGLVVRPDEHAGNRAGRAMGVFGTAGLAAGILVAQDIAIEMLANRLGWWRWLDYEGGGALYTLTGATPANFVMWFGIGLVVVSAAQLTPARRQPDEVRRLRLAGLVFFCAVGVNLALPVIAVVAALPGMLMLLLTACVAGAALVGRQLLSASSSSGSVTARQGLATAE